MRAGFESESRSQSDKPKTDPAAPTAPSPASSGFVPPEVTELADRFPHLEILELLGHGGMGAVYKARQTNLDRLIALKIIRPEATHDPAFAERFNREAKTLARLSHQHIVAVHDFGEVNFTDSADGQERPLYFFIMEYVDGANLRQLMQADQLTPQEALEIVPQICEALQFAHDEGVVHRDIKPENILLDKRGRVRIADFGLAKLATRSAEEFKLTGTHQVMGTPRYMAPEQMEGSHAVDHRADIYSLGVVFYEMLTGQVPAGHFDPPSKKVEVDVRLDEVVLRALAREPERRYQQASEVKTAVESISITQPPAKGHGRAPTTVSSDSRELLETVRRQVRGPAIGLIALGGVNLFICFMYVLGTLADWEERGWETAWQETLQLGPTVLTTMVLSIPMSIFLIVVAVQMMDVRSYRLSVAATILAMLPVSVSVVLGLPLGIWALLVLSKPHVRSGFSQRNKVTSGMGEATGPPLNPPQLLLAGIMTTLGVLCILAGAGMVAAAYVIDSPSHGTFWGLVGGGLGTAGGGMGGLLGGFVALRQRRRPPRPQVKVTPRAVGMLAGLMVLGSLLVAAGIVLLTIAVLTQQLGSGRFWGFMGGAFGCVLGGCGSIAGTWNSYRQLEGRGDLMNSADWNWLDTIFVFYTGIGVALFAAALAFSQVWGKVTIQTLLTLSAIVVFQGILLLVSRGLARRGAATSSGESETAATPPGESPLP
jgi:predicted Ser/Thr protein kinase